MLQGCEPILLRRNLALSKLAIVNQQSELCREACLLTNLWQDSSQADSKLPGSLPYYKIKHRRKIVAEKNGLEAHPGERKFE